MLDHILLPLDGSSLSECVLPHAAAMAQAMDAKITLLQVVDQQGGQGKPGAVDPLNWHIHKSEIEAYLSEIAGRLGVLDLPTEKVILEGKPSQRIIDYAQEKGVDLIILSSHGRSGLSQWNISSVVQKVILGSYITTMIVRAFQTGQQEIGDLSYQRLLLPLDGSQRAESVLSWARNMTDFYQCQLILAHVVNRPEVPRQVPLTEEEQELVSRLTELNKAKGKEYLENLKSRMAAGAETRLRVNDNPAAELHRVVKQEQVDLVLMTAHGYSGETRWPYGGVVLNFIAYGNTPLLIYQDVSPEEAHQTEAQKAAREQKGH